MAEDKDDKQLDRYMESMVAAVLQAPKLKDLPDEKKKAVAGQILERLDDLVLETLLNRLNEEQLDDIRSAMSNPEQLEEKIEFYAASVPMFYEDLNNRLQREVVALSQALS